MKFCAFYSKIVYFLPKVETGKYEHAIQRKEKTQMRAKNVYLSSIFAFYTKINKKKTLNIQTKNKKYL